MSKLPLWVSHRGVKTGAVENTVQAFRAAVAHGFTALETDLRLSSDDQIVLHHDADLSRLGGVRSSIASMTRVELERVRLGSPEARLLFFDQFLEEFAGQSWVFDIKPETGEAVLRRLHRLAKARGLCDWIAAQAKWLTWSARHERLLKELFPAAVFYARELECWRAGLCVIGGVPRLGGIREGRTYALPPRLGRIELYRQDRVAAIQRFGAKVVAFLPATAADARAAVAAGVDEVLVDGTIPGM